MRRGVVSTLTLLALSISSGAVASPILINRGGGMIYDVDQNITWLMDANFAQTSGFDADGLMTWAEADAWASQLVYGGFSDWRLPSPFNKDGSGPDSGYSLTGPEMGYLYYTHLGNPANGPLTNAGPFVNIQQNVYWTSEHHATQATRAWSFSWVQGWQDDTNDFQADQRAWAVRDGDVAAVPEPSTFLLFSVGLAAFAVWRRLTRRA